MRDTSLEDSANQRAADIDSSHLMQIDLARIIDEQF